MTKYPVGFTARIPSLFRITFNEASESACHGVRADHWYCDRPGHPEMPQGSGPCSSASAGVRGVTTGQANAVPVVIDGLAPLGTFSSSARVKRQPGVLNHKSTNKSSCRSEKSEEPARASSFFGADPSVPSLLVMTGQRAEPEGGIRIAVAEIRFPDMKHSTLLDVFSGLEASGSSEGVNTGVGDAPPRGVLR
jgi:hypothetical protein